MSWSPPPGATWHRKDVATQLSAAGAGVGTIDNNNAAVLLVIVQLSLITSPTSSAICVVSPPTGIVDTAYFAGTGDVAEGEYFLSHGDYLTLTWTGGTAGGTGIGTYYYWEVQL